MNDDQQPESEPICIPLEEEVVVSPNLETFFDLTAGAKSVSVPASEYDEINVRGSTPAWMRYLPKPPWADTYKPLKPAVPLSVVGGSSSASIKPVKTVRKSKPSLSSASASVVARNIQQQPFHRQAQALRQARDAVDKRNRVQRKLRSNVNVDEASLLLSFVKS